MATLAWLRGALEKLNSYELPEHLGVSVSVRTGANEDGELDRDPKKNEDSYIAPASQRVLNSPSNAPRIHLSIDDEVKQRYTAARESYLTQRVEEMLMEHAGTFDGTTFQFPNPPPIDTEKARKDHDRMVQTVSNTASTVSAKSRDLAVKYRAFDCRRKELASAFDAMECTDEDSALGVEENEDEENTLTTDEEAMEAGEEKLAALVRRKTDLEARLQLVHAETEEVQSERDRLRAKLREMIPTAQSVDPEHVGTSEKGTLEYSSSEGEKDDNEALQRRIEQVRAETEEAKQEAEKFQTIGSWYDDVRCAMEEISGVRILEVEAACTLSSDSECSSLIKNKKDGIGHGLVVRVLLLKEYVLLVTLAAVTLSGVSRKRRRNVDEKLRVTSAVMNGNTVVVGTDGVARCSIPSLHDLVENCELMSEPGEDLRFVVRETLARIIAVRAKVTDLVALRKKYLTKIGDGTEVTCTLNEGVTAVINLTADCPLLPGSAYVDEIVGVGGWEKKELDQVKAKVNDRLNTGTLEVMDALSNEIKSLNRRPRTPSLPLRNMR